MLDVHGLSDPSCRILNAFPFAPHLAFWQATFCGFETGRMMVPTGGGKVMGTAGNLRLLERIKSNALVATPGFAYHLLRRARPHACLASASSSDGQTLQGKVARQFGADVWSTGMHGTITLRGDPIDITSLPARSLPAHSLPARALQPRSQPRAEHDHAK